MKFDLEKAEELIQTLNNLLDILESNNFTNALALVFKANLKEPNFRDNFWVTFSVNYRKLMDIALKYSNLTNENPKDQLEVKRLLSVLRMVNPYDLMNCIKRIYYDENNTDIAKKKLRVFVNAYTSSIPKGLQYVEESRTDYVIKFNLQTIDGKKTLMFEVSIDNQYRIKVYGSGFFTSNDFEFDIDEILFEPLLFPTLESCVSDLMRRINIRESMKVTGTRLKISGYTVMLSSKELALARANVLKEGKTTLYTLSGDKLVLTIKPLGRLLDKMNTKIFCASKLYFHPEMAIKEIMQNENEEPKESI